MLAHFLKLDDISQFKSKDGLLNVMTIIIVIFFGLFLISETIYQFYSISINYIEYRKTLTQITHLNVHIKPVSTSKDISVSQFHLFGMPPVSINDADKDYSLVGIDFSEDHPEKTSVIIRIKNQDALYQVGAKLPDGAIVNKISKNEVVILDHGLPMRLTLNWEKFPKNNTMMPPDVPNNVKIPNNNNTAVSSNMLPANISKNYLQNLQEKQYVGIR